MRLPEETIRRLQPYFPTLDLTTIRVELREPSRLVPGCCGHHAGPPQAMEKAGSSPYPGLIVINPEYWAPDTLEGLRLIAHELKHQEQQQNPYFDQLYDAQAAEAEARGLEPWEIPLEREAYLFEAMVSHP